MKLYSGIYISIFPGLRNIFGALFICLSIVLYNSCEKPKSYSPIPEISLKDYQLIDSGLLSTNYNGIQDTTKFRCLVVRLNFADGDGNISKTGDRELTKIFPDTVAKDTSTYSKFYYKYYEKKQGVYFEVPDSALLTPPYNEIPYKPVMDRDGQNKTQKGEIQINLRFFYGFSKISYDTLRVDFYLTDVLWNKSNVVTISDIPLSKKLAQGFLVR